MPGSYLFEFVGHVDETRRPENFPHKIYVREQYSDLPEDKVKELYNQRAMSLILASGITVYLNEHITLPTATSSDERAFVPWHMITHLTGSVKTITEPPAQIDELNNMMPAPETAKPKKKKTRVQ